MDPNTNNQTQVSKTKHTDTCVRHYFDKPVSKHTQLFDKHPDPCKHTCMYGATTAVIASNRKPSKSKQSQVYVWGNGRRLRMESQSQRAKAFPVQITTASITKHTCQYMRQSQRMYTTRFAHQHILVRHSPHNAIGPSCDHSCPHRLQLIGPCLGRRSHTWLSCSIWLSASLS